MKLMLEKINAISAVLLVGLGLAGCASEGVTRAMSGPPQVRTDIFPGGVANSSFGIFQKAENFANIEQAQLSTKPRNAARVWVGVTPGKTAAAFMSGMPSYFPFDVRWKLKDGREFILENIDVRSISNEYLRKNPLQMGWQRENRVRHSVGDGSAILCFEVSGDSVLLKWVIRINRTPVNQRLTATGAANNWDVYDEEHLMATIKGNPTSGIDFNKTYEPRK